MRTIAYFISSHGYGHAARACAVMEKLHRKLRDVRFVIFTEAPEWFFRDSLPENSFVYMRQFTDVGFVQKSPFEEDLPATLKILQRKLPFKEPLIATLARKILQMNCQMVICDISPLGILSAEAAGVPSVLVENFTWDWMYRKYANIHQSFLNYAQYFESIYNRIDKRFQTQPFTTQMPNGFSVAPVSREPKRTSSAIRKALHIPLEAKVVLISTGGIRTRHIFMEHLKRRKDVYFIVPHDVSFSSREDNLIILPHHSPYYHPDLVRASDVVVCKSGYSTVAETYYLHKAIGLVQRPTFPESPFIEKFVKENFHNLILTPMQFQKGSWLDQIDLLWKENGEEKKHRKKNGADEIAEQLIKEF